ncbi:MAG: hypothetical protein ACE15E_21290 [Acidobacteriota bacterium]
MLLPRSCINRRLRDFNCALSLDTLQSRMMVTAGELGGAEVAFFTYFSPDLERFLSLEPTFGLRAMHRTRETQGILDHQFSPKTCFDWQAPHYLAP